jgi:succinyl-diaminopimelate desuccinylase
MVTDSRQLPSFSVAPERCEDLLRQMVRIRSVVGEDTTAHLWVSDRLKELGMTVEQYAVEGRRAPLVLGVLEGQGDGPGILFDAHFDTVHARPSDWSHDPWAADVEDGVLYGRGAVDSKGSHVAMLAAIEALVASGASRSGPIYFMSDSDGEDGFRGAVLMADLGVAARVGTIFSAEATSNTGVEISYPGISTWKVTAVGRTAHPTEPEKGINAVTKMAKLVEAVDAGRLETPRGTSQWFEPRHTIQAIRTLPGGGWTIPGRCDAVVSVMSPAGVTLPEVREAIGSFLRMLEDEDGEVRYELKVLPMGAGRLWLRPGESDPRAPGVEAMKRAVQAVRGQAAEVRRFNGGWVDAVELMRDGGDGFQTPAVITFGPGDFELAHAVDEHIAISEIAEAAEIYARVSAELLR